MASQGHSLGMDSSHLSYTAPCHRQTNKDCTLYPRETCSMAQDRKISFSMTSFPVVRQMVRKFRLRSKNALNQNIPENTRSM